MSSNNNGKTKTITLVGGDNNYDSDSSLEGRDNDNVDEEVYEKYEDDNDDDDVEDSDLHSGDSETIELVKENNAYINSSNSPKALDINEFLPRTDEIIDTIEIPVETDQSELLINTDNTDYLEPEEYITEDIKSDIIVKNTSETPSVVDSEVNENTLESDENASESINEELDIDGGELDDETKVHDSFTNYKKNNIQYDGESDSDSMYGGSDDLSIASIDSAAILSADPLYFRLTKFLTHGQKNVAEILSHNEALLNEMNNNLGNIHKALLEINKTMQDKKK